MKSKNFVPLIKANSKFHIEEKNKKKVYSYIFQVACNTSDSDLLEWLVCQRNYAEYLNSSTFDQFSRCFTACIEMLLLPHTRATELAIMVTRNLSRYWTVYRDIEWCCGIFSQPYFRNLGKSDIIRYMEKTLNHIFHHSHFAVWTIHYQRLYVKMKMAGFYNMSQREISCFFQKKIIPILIVHKKIFTHASKICESDNSFHYFFTKEKIRLALYFLTIHCRKFHFEIDSLVMMTILRCLIKS